MSSFFGWLFCSKDSSMEILRNDRQFEPVRILKTGPHYKEILCNANGNLEVAIAKVFRGNAGMREYAKEFELLTDLKHTNIVEILSKNTLDGFHILVFRNLMKISGRIEMRILFPPGSVQSLFKDLLTGLNFLHEQKIAHRDICPENLLYTEDGVLKIAGLSNIAIIRDNIKQIQLKGFIRSGMYSAPECFKPAPYSGVEADIYSAGLTLYAMLVLYNPLSTEQPLHKRVIEIINETGKIDKLATNLLVDMLMALPNKRTSIPRYLQYPFFTTTIESAMPELLQKKRKQWI
ncbi:Protein CBG10236 [Caenorhabditis briggsae]|nr:Protein CBG10236 [Caenorhabditis briggsae]CAP29743.2 Protein CBG10236 [Caenorhabditis briggsae]